MLSFTPEQSGGRLAADLAAAHVPLEDIEVHDPAARALPASLNRQEFAAFAPLFIQQVEALRHTSEHPVERATGGLFVNPGRDHPGADLLSQ